MHSLYAVFDGHGGSAASQYCVECMENNIVSSTNFPQAPFQALVDGMFICSTFRKLSLPPSLQEVLPHRPHCECFFFVYSYFAGFNKTDADFVEIAQKKVCCIAHVSTSHRNETKTLPLLGSTDKGLDDGTTAVVVLVQGNLLHVANAGDSRAILVCCFVPPFDL